MRVLLYSANFAPEPTGIGKYSGEMATWLAEQGHEVRVVAAPPYYPAWKVAEGYAWPPYRREQMNGVDVWRAPLWVPKSPGGLTRILHLLSFALFSLPVILLQALWRPHLVITVAPAFVCAPAGWLTARLCGGECWLHVQDFEIDVAFQMGLLKNKVLQGIVLGIESWMLKRFDHVSSISKRMVERLLAKGVDPKRAHYFPNWVDLLKIRPSIISKKYRQELGLSPDDVVVLFSGSLGGKQGLMVIPETATLLAREKNIVFVICGNGVMKPALEEASAGLTNVRFLPLQPLERLGELLSMADIHVLPQSPQAADLVLPSKLSGMLASGRPVIATCDAGSEIAEVLAACGAVVQPENGAALAEAVLGLARNTQRRLELGRRARASAVAFFGCDEVLTRVFGFLADAEPVFVSESAHAMVATAVGTAPAARSKSLRTASIEANEARNREFAAALAEDEAVVNDAAA